MSEFNSLNGDWRTNIKGILERQTKRPNREPTECDRHSLDLSEDLQNILEKKGIPQKFQVQSKMDKSDSVRNNPTDFKMINFTLYHRESEDVSDTSFETVEKMCDKTASDPDSTLYKYLHGDGKEKLGGIKRTLALPSQEQTIETQVLNRPLGNTKNETRYSLSDPLVENSVKNMQNGNIQPDCFKFMNTTQLEDIEAPSQLWESTLTSCDLVTKTSPVKLVGLLRPSTILEENAEDEENSVYLSKYSNSTNNKDSSSSYETACDGSVPSEKDARKSLGEQIAMKLMPRDSTDEMHAKDGAESCSTITMSTRSFSYTAVSSQTTQQIKTEEESSELYETVTYIDLTEDEQSNKKSHKKIEDNAGQNSKSNLNELGSVIEGDSLDFMERIINKDSYNEFCEQTQELNKENCSFSVNDEEDSIHFNDTLEQVEFMMKKGMELAAGQHNISKVTSQRVRQLSAAKSSKSRRSISSPGRIMNENDNNGVYPQLCCSPKFKYVGKESPIKSEKSSNLSRSSSRIDQSFTVNIKPIPKLNVFKTPASAIPLSANMRNRDHFPHIKSPIGTYVKNTNTTPLMANYKNMNDRYSNVMKHKVFRNLENDSMSEQGICTEKNAAKLSFSELAPRKLPKKAYYSSDAKHIVDERSPVTFPGGEKVQKILEHATLPTVFRHDGKMKVSGSTHIPSRIDQSTADMSVASGDISLYTVKDAKKF